MLERASKKKLIWHVYILECANLDLYTGITNNLTRRFKEHKAGRGGKFTRSFKVNKLLYSEKHISRKSALKREAQIKAYPRKKKLALVKGNNSLSITKAS
jgi:putative endonuclease